MKERNHLGPSGNGFQGQRKSERIATAIFSGLCGHTVGKPSGPLSPVSDAAGARGGGNPGAFLSNWWEPLLKGALECCGINTELAGCCFYRQVLAVTRKHSRTRVAFGSWWGFDLSTLTFDYFAIL